MCSLFLIQIFCNRLSTILHLFVLSVKLSFLQSCQTKPSGIHLKAYPDCVSTLFIINFQLSIKKAWLLHTSLFPNNKIFSYFFIVKQLKMRNFARIYPYTVHYSDYNYIK
jgi:hypothetical protein